MELDRYRALVCAIETGSLSAAAEALQYTPSGVSRMVAALEEETGVPLLLREHSGVRPTKECEKLLPAIRGLLHAGESCAQLSAQLRGGYSTELITQLNAHQLDLCFISAREGGHDWLPIGYDELTAWVPAAHPMAWLPALPVAAFAKEPYIETYPDKDIDNARRPPLRLCGHAARRAARLLSSLFICALSERRVRRRGAGACDR